MTDTNHRWLALILGGFTVLAAIYNLMTPLFEASDELWHFPMVRYVADHRFGLPVQAAGQPDSAAPWRQEGSQPPLYYMLGAALTFWIDTSDMREVRRINPHADIGIVVPDGNANMVVHRPGTGLFDRGTVLAMRLTRFLSILMGLGTVWLTCVLGRELLPDAPHVALGAAALTAFNPMFLFVSAVTNNDNLSTLLATALLLGIVRLLRRPDPPPLRFYMLLGLLAGAGMLAKFQIGFLLPLVALALVITAWRAQDWRPLVFGGAIAGGLTILIAGWWYWRNYDLYGDFTGINVFLDIVGRRAVPADLRQLWTERETFMMSFWGFFGGLNVPLPNRVYSAFNLIAVLGAAGLVAAGARRLVRPGPPQPDGSGSPLLLARLFAAAWAVIVFVSLLSWTRQTWASQGRLWFSAIAPLSIGLAAGLAGWWPRGHRVQRVLLLGAACFFVIVAAGAPFAVIAPAYRVDSRLPDGAGSAPGWTFREPDHPQAAIRLAARITQTSVRPGDYLHLSAAMWRSDTFRRDWSLFVHLISEDGGIEAQRDVYPGGGLIALADNAGPAAWDNPIAVKIPDGVYTPQTLTVVLGFYDLPTGDRMLPEGPGADVQDHVLVLGTVQLDAPPGDVPNPVDVNLGDRVTLRGYEVSDRSLPPGAPTDITLFWEARDRLEQEYVISIQVIDPDPARLTKAAQDDQPPVPPVPAWAPGETIRETRTLTVYPDAAPGRYRLLVRVYPAGDPSAPLRVRGGAGAQSEDFVWLGWIQVEQP